MTWDGYGQERPIPPQWRVKAFQFFVRNWGWLVVAFLIWFFVIWPIVDPQPDDSGFYDYEWFQQYGR